MVITTEAITAFINGGGGSSSTQSGPSLEQTASMAASGRHAGHERIAWV